MVVQVNLERKKSDNVTLSSYGVTDYAKIFYGPIEQELHYYVPRQERRQS